MTPEERQRLLKARRRFKSKASRGLSLVGHSPENEIKRINAIRAAWADPAKREHMLENLARARAQRKTDKEKNND